jgi:chemotaxis protein MotB
MSKKAHHGGAWKVAYADFVTAMMALFMVLWLTAQDQHIKEAVERAFRNPFSSVTKESVGIIPNEDVQAVRNQSGNFDSSSAVELAMLRRLNDDLNKTLQSKNELEENPIKLELTPDGLRISVFDRAQRPIFERDSVQFTEYGKWIFTTLAWEISRYGSFNIELEGHTDRRALPLSEAYDAWLLTAERANATRRILLNNGVRGEQVRKVSGFADTLPMPDLSPSNEANRRVAVMLRIRSHEPQENVEK